MTRQPVNIKEFEASAKEKMETLAFHYYAGGAGDEETLRENQSAFLRYVLRPRVLVDVSKISMETTLLGQRVSMPLGMAPTAFHRLAHPDAEVASARAAARANVVFCASTMSSCSLEEISVAGGTRWFQLYTHKERDITQDLIKRAEAADYKALVLTVDLPVFGRRERDEVHNFTLPRATLGNFKKYSNDTERMTQVLSGMHDASLSWESVGWIKSQSSLPLILKGIMCGEDARLAVEHGASAVVVSNHGGRQLDRCGATIDALREIVEAVDGRCEVFVDGGFRRGVDVAVALAMGARAAFIGRPYLYGLAHSGEEGAFSVLQLFRRELENVMCLLGTPSVDSFRASHIRLR
jgi:(S)-2-hydroxy-acid oxidase